MHSKNLKCQKGCDSCCESISVFPIEFDSIKQELGPKLDTIAKRKFNKFRKSCMFLKNGACLIYHSRPIICRTQGLPLMYQSIKSDGYEVSHCQLNFNNFNISDFTVDNTLFMPEFNSKLFSLNKEYIEAMNILKMNPRKRIPLYKLVD